jgi:hypothetical protein
VVHYVVDPLRDSHQLMGRPLDLYARFPDRHVEDTLDPTSAPRKVEVNGERRPELEP